MDLSHLVLDLSGVRLLDHDRLVCKLIEYCDSIPKELAVTLCLERWLDFVPSEHTVIQNSCILAAIFISCIFFLLDQIAQDLNLFLIGPRNSYLRDFDIVILFGEWWQKVVPFDIEQVPLRV